MLKLVSGVPSYRNFRICARMTNVTNPKSRLFDGRTNNRRLSQVPSMLNYKTGKCESLRWRYFCSTSSSRSSQKNVDKSSEKEKELPASVIPGEEFANLGLIARFKKMYKEYWYILVPVHLVTSAVWFGSFYYASTRYLKEKKNFLFCFCLHTFVSNLCLCVCICALFTYKQWYGHCCYHAELEFQ